MYVWIGTSGYSYLDWVGDFYPLETSPAQMLPYYCTQFPLVELNFTFYRPPTRAMLLRLAAKTPPEFQFLVKVPQSISHKESPLDLPGFRHAAEGLKNRNQLSGVLCQFPQAFHCTRQHCNWISTLASELKHLHLCIEFRHRSWFRPGLSLWLAEKGISLVAVDVPDLPGLFPGGWMQSTSTAYIRLHSRNKDVWYSEGGERYDYNYSDEELGEWIGELTRHQTEGGTERALILFNNCQRSQAAINARRMQTLLNTEAPQVNLVRVFESQQPKQLMLFSNVGNDSAA